MKKTKPFKRYSINPCKYLQISNHLSNKLLFLNNFSLFFIFSCIKYKFSKKFFLYKSAGQKKRRFIKRFFRKKYLTLKYIILKKLIFKIFQFSQILDKTTLFWLYKQNILFKVKKLNSPIRWIFTPQAYFNKKLLKINEFIRAQNFSSIWRVENFFYKFLRNFYFKYLLSDFIIDNKLFSYNNLFFIPIKNINILQFTFKLKNFKSLVKETHSSAKYRASFKLHKKLVVKNIKRPFFLLKRKHFRWLQTHINFILDVRANFYFPRFIFLEKKYLQKLSFLKIIYNEYWLAKYLFSIKNNRRWLRFFSIFKPQYYLSVFRNFKIKKLQKLNSIQFNWLIRTQKYSLLKYYYLVKYSKLSFFFYFYIKLLWRQIFNTDIVYIYRRFKFKQKIKNLIQSLYIKFNVFERQLKPSFFLYEVLEIIFISMRTKNASFFHKWLCSKLSKIYYKKHFKVLNFISLVFNTYFKFFKSYYQIKGIQYVVKGKINMKGSVRKRKVIYQTGKVSYTDLSIRNSNNFGIARTDTGAIGVFFLIAF